MASQQWMNICSVISDHLIQFFIEPKSLCKTTSNVKKEVRCFKNFNQQAFKSSLDKINWARVLNTNNPNSNLKHFFDIINALWDKYTPYQNLTKNYSWVGTLDNLSITSGITWRKQKKLKHVRKTIKEQGLTNLIFVCTDFCAHEMVLCALSCMTNYVCIRQSLQALIYII